MRQQRKLSVFHRNQKHLRFIWSAPSKSRHHGALLQALPSLASPFQTGRVSWETNGPKHSWSRAKELAQLTWLKQGLVKSQFLPFHFFLSFLSAFLTISCASCSGWADKEMHLQEIQAITLPPPNSLHSGTGMTQLHQNPDMTGDFPLMPAWWVLQSLNYC